MHHRVVKRKGRSRRKRWKERRKRKGRKKKRKGRKKKKRRAEKAHAKSPSDECIYPSFHPPPPLPPPLPPPPLRNLTLLAMGNHEDQLGTMPARNSTVDYILRLKGGLWQETEQCQWITYKEPRIQTAVLGHSLVRSLVRSHRSLVRLLRTARFARALHCAHSLARSLTSLTPSLVEKCKVRCLKMT